MDYKKLAGRASKVVGSIALAVVPVISFAAPATFTLVAPSVDTDAVGTMTNFALALPQLMIDFVTSGNNFALLLIVVVLGALMGMVKWLRSRVVRH